MSSSRRLSVSIFIVLLGMIPLHSLRAQSVNPAEIPSTNLSAKEADELTPLPVPLPTPLALEFHRTGNGIWLIARFWDFVVPALLLFTGASARLAGLTKRIGGIWYFEVSLFAAAYLAIVYAAEFPLHYYSGFVRQHAYGLSNQTFAKWLTDSFKRLGIEMVGAFVLVWVPMRLIRCRPKSWWWIASFLVVPYIAFMMLIAPVVIDPVFNDFGPMRDQALEAKILELADRAGIEGGRVFEVNKSVDTNAVNAYVTGLFSTKRIVLWDTLIKKLDDREILVVMGHEMGHYALNHVGWSVALSGLILVAGLFWVDRAGRWLLGRYSNRLGFDNLGSVAAIPLLTILGLSASVALGPIALAYSRHNEAEADRFSMELTRMNRSGARAFADLQRENLGVPYHSTLETLWRGTHPSLGERIEFCNTYHPWTEGKPLRYACYFKR